MAVLLVGEQMERSQVLNATASTAVAERRDERPLHRSPYVTLERMVLSK